MFIFSEKYQKWRKSVILESDIVWGEVVLALRGDNLWCWSPRRGRRLQSSCDTGYQPKISLKLIFHNIGLDVMPGYGTKVSEFEAEIPIPGFAGITGRSIIIMRTSSCQRWSCKKVRLSQTKSYLSNLGGNQNLFCIWRKIIGVEWGASAGFQFLSSSSWSSIFSNCCSRRVTPDARRALWEAVRCLAPSLTGSIIIMITWPKPAFGWLALGRIITFHYSNIRSLRLFGGEKTATHQQISKNVTDRSSPLFKPAGSSLCAVSRGG